MNFSRLDVETAMAMLSPEMPMAKRNRTANIKNNCQIDGNPTKTKQVIKRGVMYSMPRSPPDSTRPMANSSLVIGKLSM